jgi:ATP-binding cassette subfamily F protein 3
MQAGSPVGMVPMIRNILGGFLFSGDDIYKKAGVLSGGERTRLAVARMLLRPANVLLLDEPTNHLDLDSKDVLLDALADFGGTLVFVSHDRYFVDKLANKILVVGHGSIETYPGTYEQFLWSRKERAAVQDASASPPVTAADGPPSAPVAAAKPVRRDGPAARAPRQVPPEPLRQSYDQKKKADGDARRLRREQHERQRRITQLEALIAEREQSIRDLEAAMAATGFYDDRAAAEASIAHHQSLMWEVGDLMAQWESLQTSSTTSGSR